jgi:hypothetical protein
MLHQRTRLVKCACHERGATIAAGEEAVATTGAVMFASSCDIEHLKRNADCRWTSRHPCVTSNKTARTCPHTASHSGSPWLPSRAASSWSVTSRGARLVAGQYKDRRRATTRCVYGDAAGEAAMPRSMPGSKPASRTAARFLAEESRGRFQVLSSLTRSQKRDASQKARAHTITCEPCMCARTVCACLQSATSGEAPEEALVAATWRPSSSTASLACSQTGMCV